MNVAHVFIIDISSHCRNGNAAVTPPLAWCCAAEMAGCASAWDVVQELWLTSTTKQCGDSGPRNTALSVPFPLVVEATNRYFSTSIQATVVDCASQCEEMRGDKSASTHQRQQQNATALIQDVLGASGSSPKVPYGCIFVVEDSQYPDEVAWHAIPRSEALFSAVLVYERASTGASFYCGDGRSSESGYEKGVAAAERWRRACVMNQYEYIPHAGYGSSRGEGAFQLEVVPSGAGATGLLGGTLTGSARVVQILCNTMWPETVRRPHHRLEEKQAAQREANYVLLVGTETVATLLKYFEAPQFISAIEGAATGREVMTTTSKDDRFFTKAISATPLPLLGENSKKRCYHVLSADDDERNLNNGQKESQIAEATSRLLLCNKYYAAVVEPVAVHTAMFNPSMSDVLRSQFERETAQHSSSGYAAAFVFWPPRGSEGHVFQYPALSTVLDTIRSSCGASLSITVVTQYDAPNVILATSADQQNTALKRWMGRQAVRRGALDTFERQVCQERQCEVVTLLPQWNRQVGTGEEHLDDAEEDETTGADRLRELLHCVEWAHHQEHHWGGSQAMGTGEGGAAVAQENRLLICAYGDTAAQEEALLAQTCAHGLPVSVGKVSRAGHVEDQPATGGVEPLLLEYLPSLSSTGGPLFVTENKYFNAKVRVSLYGGLAVRQGVWNMAAPRVRNYHAVLVTCTLAELQAAAAASSNSDSNRKRHLSLVKILRELQQCLQEQNALGMMGEDGRSIQEVEEMMGMLHVVGGSEGAANAAAVAVEAALTKILFPDHPRQDDAEVEFPLMEIILGSDESAAATAMSATREENSDEGFLTDGFARVREALEQHVWPLAVRHALHSKQSHEGLHSASIAHSAATSSENSRAEGSYANVVTVDASCKAGISAHDEQTAEIVLGCELPPTYLIEPETLRSTQVSALVYLKSKDFTQSKTAKTEENSAHYAELMEWMDRMKQFGGRLSWRNRQRQAGVLATALEGFM